jgi:Mn2+/Fe2+ NRAMP family transporter
VRPEFEQRQPDNVVSFPAPASPHPSILRQMLPGIVAGAADLDPAAVLTATVAGATFQYSLIWVVAICLPVLQAVFSVSARLGSHAGRGLIAVVRDVYGRKVATPLAFGMVVVNMMMIIGDLVAVSDSLAVVLQQNRIFFLAGSAFVVWSMLILGQSGKVVEKMGMLALAQLAYVAAAYMATPGARVLARGVIPPAHWNADYVMGLIAVFGSLLTPDVIVWQTSSKQDRPEAVESSHVAESRAASFVACAISIAVMIAASRLHVANPTSMSTRAAAEALHPLGPIGPLVFSIGILGSGLVALPLLVASLCFSLAEAFDWPSGLSRAPWEAPRFYVLISGSLFVATIVDFTNINTVQVLYWSQVLAGMLIVPILWALLRLGRKPTLVRRVNTRFETWALSVAVVGMLIANLAFVWSLLS